MSARVWIVLVLVAAHGLVLWLLWRGRAPVTPEVEAATSVLFFFPEPYQAVARPIGLVEGRAAPQAHTHATVTVPAIAQPSTAITLPASPSAVIDWSAQLTGAAAAALEKQRKGREQLGALQRKFRTEEDPRALHPDPRRGFRWDDAGSHRFDTRGFLPAWHLNERCVLVAFIFAACAIGHIEVHGDLFDGAAQRHDETLATHRPNDAP